MRTDFRSLLCLMVFVLLVCVSHGAEAQTAWVIVVVTDVDGKAIKDAQVTVTNPGDVSYVKTGVTDKKGKVKFGHSDSGPTYTYEIAKEGYQTMVAEAHSEYSETARMEAVLLPEKTGEVSGQDFQAALSQSRAYTVFNEGVEAQKQGDLELAKAKFQEATGLDPTLPEPYIALAVVAYLGEDYATAAAQAEVALGIDPSNEQAILLRYDSYRLLGIVEKTVEAAEALRGTSRIADAAASVFNEGLETYKSGNMEAAVVSFEQALDLNPELVSGYVMLGSIALSQGEYQEAAAKSAKALEIEPMNADALKVRYDACRNLDDKDCSQQALDSLIEADPEWVRTGLLSHATELYNADLMESAAIALATVIEAQPDDINALFMLGMALYNLGDTDEAKIHLARFLELAPDDPDAEIAREMLKFASN